MWAKRKGFTIVELMVVIVVIGILAGISTVAYNGAQQRARDTKRIHDVEAIVSALTGIATKNNPILFDTSGAGANAATVGLISTGPPTNPETGYTISIKQWLINNEYLKDGVTEPNYVYNTRDYAVTLCKDSDYGANRKNRRVVMARLENPPSKTLDQQLAGSGCTSVNPWVNDNWWYTFFQANYGMNYAQMVDIQ